MFSFFIFFVLRLKDAAPSCDQKKPLKATCSLLQNTCDGKVDQLLASCRTLAGVEANRNLLIPIMDVVSLDNACGCQERYQVRTELGSCFERGQTIDWHTSVLPVICSAYRSCLELYFPSCLSERDRVFILEEIREEVKKEVRIKADSVGFPRLACLQSCISGDTAPCKTTTETTSTTTTTKTTITTPSTTQRPRWPTLRPSPTSWPPCQHTSIRPTVATTLRPPCHHEVQVKPTTVNPTQRPPCNLEEPPPEKTTERPSPRPTPHHPTQRPIQTSTLGPTTDCPCCQTSRPPKPPSPQTTQRPTTTKRPPCRLTVRPRPSPRPTNYPTRRPPCQRKRKSKDLKPREQTAQEIRYHAEEIQLSDKEDSDTAQQTLISNSTSSSSSILVLKENTAIANPDPAPVASLLTDKKQLGPSSGLSPGICRGPNCGFSGGQALKQVSQSITALIVACSSITLILKLN